MGSVVTGFVAGGKMGGGCRVEKTKGGEHGGSEGLPGGWAFLCKIRDFGGQGRRLTSGLQVGSGPAAAELKKQKGRGESRLRQAERGEGKTLPLEAVAAEDPLCYS